MLHVTCTLVHCYNTISTGYNQKPGPSRYVMAVVGKVGSSQRPPIWAFAAHGWGITLKVWQDTQSLSVNSKLVHLHNLCSGRCEVVMYACRNTLTPVYRRNVFTVAIWISWSCVKSPECMPLSIYDSCVLITFQQCLLVVFDWQPTNGAASIVNTFNPYPPPHNHQSPVGTGNK